MAIAQRIGCAPYDAIYPTGRQAKPRASKLDPYKLIIGQLLADNIWNAEIIFQLIRDQGYEVAAPWYGIG